MVLKPGIPGVVATIVVATVPVFARVARGPTLTVRTTEYTVRPGDRCVASSDPLPVRAAERLDAAAGPARIHAVRGR
jgi:hypothetical protein